MPIITASILTIAKGAIFLAKSAAVKGAVAKCGAYLVGHYGVATTASVAITASAITGTVLTVTSTAEKAKKGYCYIVDGLLNRSFSQFCDGVYHLIRAGMNANSIVNEFDNFVDNLDCDYEVKVDLKKSMKGVKWLVYDQAEQKGISLLKEAEKLLRKSGYSNELYVENVNAIYRDHTYDLDISKDDYIELLGRAGRIYSDMCNLNILSGIRKENSNEYDHYLVYCIAGWIKDHLLLSCLNGKSQREIADDITNNILEYLKNNEKYRM